VDELPAAARRYVAAIEERAGAPINVISVGPERTQTLSVDAGRVTSARRGAGTAA
jgi:adenylosuccinate synthase